MRRSPGWGVALQTSFSAVSGPLRLSNMSNKRSLSCRGPPGGPWGWGRPELLRGRGCVCVLLPLLLLQPLAAAAAAAAGPAGAPGAPPASPRGPPPLKPGAVCKSTLDPSGNPLEEALARGPPPPAGAPRGAPPSHPAFAVASDRLVGELGLRVTQYLHKASGLEVWNLESEKEEEEMAFNICFRTPVSDSTGAAHVLEHAVLNGSELFAPAAAAAAAAAAPGFLLLQQRSLNSYANAWTWPDRTCFPFASSNSKDFQNLLSFYLSCVFRPLALAQPHHLRQEGWRYEAVPRSSSSSSSSSGSSSGGGGEGEAAVDCETSPELCELAFGGVVYSEMKGVWGIAAAAEELQRLQQLFPALQTYAQVAGGRPPDIPLLQQGALAAFHRALYVPRNAWITFFGGPRRGPQGGPPLDFLDKFLTQNKIYSPQPPQVVGVQHSFKAPVYAEFPFASLAKDPKDLISVSWVLNPCPAPPSGPPEGGPQGAPEAGECPGGPGGPGRVALQVLDQLLLGSPACLLRKALAQSGLGLAVYAPGLDLDLKYAQFTVGLKEVQQQEGAAAAVERLVLQTLEAIAAKGFSAAEIEAAFNKVDFSLRETPRKELPRGLIFSQRMAQELNYNRDPLGALEFEQDIWRLRERLAAGEKVFENMVKELLLENPHRVTLRMKSSAEYAEQQAAEERAALTAAEKEMGLEGIRQVAREHKALKLLQVTPQTQPDCSSSGSSSSSSSCSSRTDAGK
ncbi:Presequence protease, related [Eimeria tenella]|uniref:Presequence protease, related n=1 Tax=Eimeria tenella TaxID=5802 RepID=U6L294_EIMTE|nr:Presequence protease, related [Eimeria tenella]CDJ44497.1 Presequence protease, related [Eimeria tenella]|eukprot:XP_013235246.1 Presequence protease, related [Eimeria tenella]